MKRSIFYFSSLFISLFLFSQPLQAQTDSVAQCAEGTELFFADEPDRAGPLVEAGLDGGVQADFDDQDDLGVCAWVAGTLRKRDNDFSGALDAYQMALDTFKSSHNRNFEADTLDSIGEVYTKMRHYEDAVAVYLQALDIHQALADLAEQEMTLNDLGVAYYRLGQYAEALTIFEQRLVVDRSLSNRAEEGITLNNIGLINSNLGHYPEALTAYQQSLVIKKELNNRQGEGITLTNLGQIYKAQGRYEEALTVYEQALVIARDLNDWQSESVALRSIGVVYEKQGRNTAALEIYEEALAVDRQQKDEAGQGATLNNMGLVYKQLGRYEQALEVYEQALAIKQALNDRPGQSIVLNNMGLVYAAQGRQEEALTVYEQSLAIDEALGRQAGLAATLNNIATVYENQGRYTEALAAHNRALTIDRALGRPASMATSLNNIGLVYKQQGQFNQALTAYQEALTLFQENGNRGSAGTVLNNMGVVYETQGRYEEALAAYEQALAIHRQTENRPGEANTLNNIGLVYYSQNRQSKALTTLQQALAVIETGGNLRDKATILNSTGLVYSEQSQFKQALSFFEQALAIQREAGYREGEHTTLTNIGAVYKRQGKNREALDVFNQSLAIIQRIGSRADEALALNNIGVVYSALEQPEKAMDFYRQALAIHQEVGNPAGESLVLGNLSDVYRKLGRNDEALTAAQQALDIGETIRAAAGSEQGRSSFIAQFKDEYDFVVAELHRQGEDEAAFFTAERSRARSFLDSLATGQVQLNDSDADIFNREEEAYRHRQTLLDTLIKARAQSPPQPGRVAALESQLAQAEELYAQARAVIEARNNRLVELLPNRGAKNVPTVADIQAYLPPNSTLVAYYSLDEQTLAFVIASNAFAVIELNISQAELSQKVEFFRKLIDLRETDATRQTAAELYQILIAPLDETLNTPHLLIVPHGRLHYLPFAALLHPKKQRYLIEDYSLALLPSAAGLPFIQQNAAQQRHRETPNALILGNPSTAQFDPLPFAQKEAEAIAALYGNELLLQATATETAVRQQAAESTIIHLAAHGSYNAAEPLKSLIALAPDSVHDGMLSVSEVYGLNLHQTDLVVLSACQTQLGDLSGGDDVIGLTRAFTFAGTPTVMATLWNVNDAATSFLMTRFYTHLVSGLSKAEALQRAQLDTLAEYPDPFYWAAVTLSGDGGRGKQPEREQASASIELQQNNKSGQLFWFMGGCGLLLIIGVLLVVVAHKQRRPSAP